MNEIIPYLSNQVYSIFYFHFIFSECLVFRFFHKAFLF